MNSSNEFLARVYGAYNTVTVKSQFGVHTLFGVTTEGVYVSVGKERLFREFQGSSLLLTPLSQISDEDAIEVAALMACPNSSVKSKIEWGKYYIMQIIRLNGTYSCLHLTKTIDYLRSKGYDAGYGEIPSLIEAGIAIDKTTLK